MSNTTDYGFCIGKKYKFIINTPEGSKVYAGLVIEITEKFTRILSIRNELIGINNSQISHYIELEEGVSDNVR